MKSGSGTPIEQLPLWHERVRGLPNPIARSALFAVGNQNRKRVFYTTHKTIHTLAGCQITYKGEELRQDDADVFMQMVHLARTHALGERVEFTAYSFLREIGWSCSQQSYERLRATLDRLQGTGLRITADGSSGEQYGFQGALVRMFSWKDDSDAPLARWVVYLEPTIVKLFAPDGYTQLWWAQRQRLKSALAKFLHAYYSTHAAPYALKVLSLRELSGSKSGRVTDFRKALRAALDQLVAQDFLDDWSIDHADVVHVVRKSKARQLAAQATLDSLAA